MAVFYGQKDVRIKFSPIWTLVNFLVSSSQVLVIKYLLGVHLIDDPIHREDRDEDGDGTSSTTSRPEVGTVVRILHEHIEQVFLAVVCLHVLSALLTTILIFFDSVFCWCSPGFLGEGEWTVFDPEHPESNLALRDGNVVDLDKDDGEQLANVDDENALAMGIKIS